MGYWVDWQGQLRTLRAGYIRKVFMPLEDFPLLYPGVLLLPPGEYNHRLNLVNID